MRSCQRKREKEKGREGGRISKIELNPGKRNIFTPRNIKMYGKSYDKIAVKG